MTQILREAARKMVSSLSFKTFKMKFQKEAVKHNDGQVLLYPSQRVDHTHYYATCGWLILKFERKLQRGGGVGVGPKGRCFASRTHHR